MVVVPRLLVVVVVVAAGCSSGKAASPETSTTRPVTQSSSVDTRAPSTVDTASYPVYASSVTESPPIVTVDSDASTVVLTAWTWSTRWIAADGTAPANPPDLGTISAPLTVRVDSVGWALTATIVGPSCTVHKMVEQTGRPPTAPGLLSWTGPAGRYVVTIDGNDSFDRTLHVTFAASIAKGDGCG
jgi:hypothetical protein